MPHRTDTHATPRVSRRTRRSTQRQRTRQCLVRFTEDEFTRVSEKADRAGLAAAAYLRATALGDAGPRAQRRPPVDHQTLRRLLGEVARVGNNINQIARALNQGELLQVPELRGDRSVPWHPRHDLHGPGHEPGRPHAARSE